MSVSRSLLLGLLGATQGGLAVRTSLTDLEGTASEWDHLRVLYKHCFAKALKDAMSNDLWHTPLLVEDGFTEDADDAHLRGVRDHWILLRRTSFACSLKMTAEPSEQHAIEFSEVKERYDPEDQEAAEKLYNAYPMRPHRSWWELGLDGADQAELDAALKALYMSAFRNKRGHFYIYDWQIKGECLDANYGNDGGSLVSDSGYGTPAKTIRCHEVMSGEGNMKFSAAYFWPNDDGYVHLSGTPPGFVDQDATFIGEKTEYFGAAFQSSCKKSFHDLDPLFDGISAKFCSGEEFYKCGEKGVDGCSSTPVVSNVQWKDGSLKWKQ